MAENKPYIEGMRQIRRSSKAQPMDNRPKRLRTRNTVKQHEIKEQRNDSRQSD